MEIHLKYIVLFVGLLSMFFAALPKYKFRYGLEVAWLIIFAFLAIRYDFGNDYMNYLEFFNNINSYGSYSIDLEDYFEPGWQILCKAFGSFGFNTMVIVLTAIECLIFYKFVKQYVPEKYYWFSIFLYVFNPHLMLIGASMIRNTLVVALFVWSVKYIREHKLFPFLLLITIAAQIHSSAVVLYPFYLLGYLDKIKFNIWISLAIIVAYIVLDSFSVNMQLGDVVESIAEFVGEEEAMEYYTESHKNYNMSTSQGSGMGVVLIYLVFGYIVMTIQQYPQNSKIFFLLLVIGMFVRPLVEILYVLVRFNYYFYIFQIVCYPIILSQLPHTFKNIMDIPLTMENTSRLLIIMVIVFMTITSFNSFFISPIWINKYSTYNTILGIL